MCERESIGPDCEFEMDAQLPRRDFMKVTGGAVAVGIAGVSAQVSADEKPAVSKTAVAKPAEDLIRELHAGLSEEQKKKLVLPWNHGADQKGKTPSRLGMYNRPFKGQRIADSYTKPQQELVERTLRAICAGDEGYLKISRAGRFDSSKSLAGCGSHIFGDPASGKFSWVFSGHHLTVRCDGDSEPQAAFGGPMYYGHLAQGYSTGNVYYFQTRQVQEVFKALDEKQRKNAVATGSPGEQAASVRFRKDDRHPGIGVDELSGDQRELVTKVMRDLVAPFRKEDGDEVMEVVKANGGLEKLHLAFYKDKDGDDKKPWHFWRVEGPGFVWNYRVTPHVHCFVNIARLS